MPRRWPSVVQRRVRQRTGCRGAGTSPVSARRPGIGLGGRVSGSALGLRGRS
ncbi:hypothetical protein ACFPM0_34550 [Pseudonocardia sulfidoxydans]|uniref:hypothetical protein n=1 Tax=Pseudonocardia sulfidoxydans TaxID=54011 RepID=UPI003622DD50